MGDPGAVETGFHRLRTSFQDALGRPSLAEWALGSFHAAGLLLAGLLAGHATDGLADLLGGGGGETTLLGAGAYAFLLVTTVVTVRIVVHPADLEPPEDGRGAAHTLGRAVLGGAFNAVAFVLPLFGLLVGTQVGLDPDGLTSGLFVLGIALPVAIAIGSGIGFVFGVLDLACVLVVDRLTPSV
jgi:hypothetical protein